METTSDYSRRFGGIARLYGQAAADALRRAHVCVVGVGGVGSWAVETLARSGIGRLTLVDLDNVAPSNTNRQIHALTPDFGKAKVAALAERIAQINPECETVQIEDFADENNLDALFRLPFSFVIDAIDQGRVKTAMAARFVRTGQPFVCSGGAGVYSREQTATPQNAACDAAPQGLSCAGYGSSMAVTAAFGLHCAAAAIEHIAARAQRAGQDE